MRSVASDLRASVRRQSAQATATTRVELALELGEDDLDIFCQAHRMTREEGRRQLRRARQVGRTPCRCLAESL